MKKRKKLKRARVKKKISRTQKKCPQKKGKKKKLGKRELKMYRESLLKQKELIVGEIQHITKDTLKKSQKDASGDISGYTYHMADVATDNYDREFSLGLASSEREIVYDINEALKRIEDGIYGNCQECDKSITKKRLKAVPYAKYCIKCQEGMEKRKDRS